jgi:prepilin-type N-terminal cleavage/methylation domain-containing protein
MSNGRSATGQAGLGLIEIVLALAILAIAGAVLYHYVGSTQRTVETLQERRPLAHARLAADQATLASIQTMLRTYQAQHGQWPPDRAGVLALLPAAPRFQCPGNDFAYDAAGGSLRLLVTDPARC